MNRLWLLAALLLVLIAGSASAQNLPTRSELPAGTWIQITPGGETICGHGAPYSFYYHEGAGQDLLIDFQGGGMCWNAQTCNVSTTTFDDWVSPSDPSDNPDLFPVGVTNLYTPDNPFVDYDMVFVDYCTGDMHTGNNVQGYDYNGTWFDVKHKGAVNAATVLNWVYTNFTTVDSVFVTGCSAGAIGAAYWSADIKSHYPDTRVTLVGDSGGGWRNIASGTWNLWGTNYQDTTGDALSIQQFYVGAAQAGVRIAEYNSANDETQNFFNYVGFSGVRYADALRANLSDISASVDSFRYYTQGGELHCIIPRTEFYDYATNGVRVRDWFADLAAGEPVSNVVCTACAVPEYKGQ